MLENEFVSFKLHDGLGFNRDRGSIGVDSGAIFLLSPHQVVHENRSGFGCGAFIHPGSSVIVEHRPS